MNSRAILLKRQIEQAFADVPYPGDDNICADKCSLEECFLRDGVEAYFRGKHWRDLSRSIPTPSPTRLTPAALHFYLPAYLLGAIEKPPGEDREFKEGLGNVAFNLLPRTAGIRDQFFEVLAAFPPDQKNAIKGFLEYARDEMAGFHLQGDALKALKYWGRDWTRPAEIPASPMPSRADQLRECIEQAFAGVPYPGDTHIGCDPDDWEGAEVNAHFQGKPWKEVPRYALLYHDKDLASFSPAGLQYYLPTYLFAAIDSFGDTPDFTVYHLEPDDGELRDYFLERMAVFTPAQRGAIKAFLEYVRDEMSHQAPMQNVLKALEYWSTSLAPLPAGPSAAKR